MRRAGCLCASILLIALVACDDDPVEPESPTPVLSDFSYTLEELNLAECPPSNLENSSQFRWTVEYADVNGDVAPPIVMAWSSTFNPGGRTESAVLLIPAAAVTEGDGFSGTIAQTQCVRFVEQESIDITVSILDQEGNQSDPVTLRIEKPEGAFAPPARDSHDPSAGLLEL